VDEGSIYQVICSEAHHKPGRACDARIPGIFDILFDSLIVPASSQTGFEGIVSHPDRFCVTKNIILV